MTLCAIGALVANLDVAALTPDNTSDKPSIHSLVEFVCAVAVFALLHLVRAKVCALRSRLQTWFATRSLGFVSAFVFDFSV